MNKTPIEVKEDEVFYTLDDVLEQAIWRRGRVYIAYGSSSGRSQYTCSNQRTLRNALLAIARDIKQQRFPEDQLDIPGVVDNILEECKNDIRDNAIPENRSYR